MQKIHAPRAHDRHQILIVSAPLINSLAAILYSLHILKKRIIPLISIYIDVCVCVCLFEHTNVCLYINVEDYH